MMRFASWGMALILAVAVRSPAQEVGPGDGPEDPMAGPTEHGIRLTPGIARSLGRVYAREVLVRRYEMDDSKRDHAAELVARRIMRFAHDNEEKGQEVIEELLAQAIDINATSRHDGPGGIPLELAKSLGQRLPPLMPAIREMINDVATDVRPMLPLKGQVKLTGELTMVNLAADAFEKELGRWAKGYVDPVANPFGQPRVPPTKDDNGETQLLKNARRMAERWGRLPGARMDSYLEAAKKYYQFDASQSSAGDSLLRDYKERARIAVGGEQKWRAEASRSSFWISLSDELPGRWYNPVSTFLWGRMMRQMELVFALQDEFADKIDDIPTDAQRRAADDRFRAAVKEKGYECDESLLDATTTAPADKAGR